MLIYASGVIYIFSSSSFHSYLISHPKAAAELGSLFDIRKASPVAPL